MNQKKNQQPPPPGKNPPKAKPAKAKKSLKKKLQENYVWTFSTYFTEGFPFSVFRQVSGVFFRDMAVSLEGIGLTSLFGLPWITKFLWAPQVDEYGTKRKWLLGSQFLLLVVLVLTAVFAPLEFSVQAIAILFFIGSILAATHDIAIDGYYMEALDKDGQAKFVGYRVMAYRIAMITGSMIIIPIGVKVSWFAAYLFGAVVFGLFFLFHQFFLKEVEQQRKTFTSLLLQGLRIKTFVILITLVLAVLGIRFFFKSSFYGGVKEQFPLLKKIYFSHWVAVLLFAALILVGIFRKRLQAMVLKDPDSFYSKAFYVFMERKQITRILAFILLLRTGEWTLSTMVSPFMVDLGIAFEYGIMNSTVGLPASIAGAMLGGWMISRFSLKRVIWPFILAQNFTNVIYMFLAFHLNPYLGLNSLSTWNYFSLHLAPLVPADLMVNIPSGIGAGNLALVAGVHGFDQFAGGLGTAVLMTYLMRICDMKYKAAHYAIGSALMNLTGLFAGVLSGFIAGWLGYAWLFGLSFVAAVPAMVIIPFLPYLKEDAAAPT